MNAFEKIAQEKIREAIANGEFDNLPGKGKPLILTDEPNVPPHLRMSFKILKNANILPEEVQLRKDISLLQQQLLATSDESEQRTLRRQIGDLETHFNILMERHRRQIDK